ncbi:DUF418 domain-containing protein [Thalassotalea sp. 1_MG-2023]|uniref:DUF418 domain-containing protein n=1 Tax=Thalassotalea sp. 1_MG-2023 TaxID=3062680 RepID=UPI0026E2121D|nr:DUF418 domain-containing protein [Thalassotalea sp. 1_MG-2023]MDO6426938.1 DUF418 domain-containing protein [Thalassotalea sp. 1_MG-2023]
MLLTAQDRVHSTKRRIRALDTMRGFALCGIIFANLVSFTGFYSLSFNEIQALSWWDRGVLFVIDFLIEGKFYSVFATLLGVGFALQYAKYNRQDKNFTTFWLKRMLVLFVIGLSHMYLIWHGDILTLYSLLGVCLLFFKDIDDTRLRYWIIVLLCAPLVMHLLLSLTSHLTGWNVLTDIVYSLRKNLGYQDVSLLSLRTAQEAKDVFWGNIFSAIPRPMAYLKTGRPFQVLGQFLLGLYLARIYLRGQMSVPSKSNIIALFVVGAGFSAIYAYIKAITGSPFSTDFLGLFQGLVYHVSCIMMALAYMALLYRLSHNGVSFSGLSQLGRMALTMYLMQTTVCVLLFYGYGFAWMGNVPFYSIIVFGTCIISIQLLFARYWLKNYQLGPLEYLWRRLT